MPPNFAIVPVEVCMDGRLSKMQIRVLVALLSFRAKNTDTVWPKRSQIAERCGYDERVITRVTTQLVKLGWLEKVGKGGFSKSCEYRITVPEFEEVPRGTVTDSVAVEDEKEVPDSPDNGNQSGNGNQIGNGNQTGANNGNQFGASTVTDSVTGNKQTNNRPITDQYKYMGDFDFSEWPGFPEKQTWEDFKKVRKAHRAPITQTVINKLGKEYSKASMNGYTVERCLQMQIEKNWRSFEFNWITNLESRHAAGIQSNVTPINPADEALYRKYPHLRPQ